MKIVTAAQMRALDEGTISMGTPSAILMDRAGKAVADRVISMTQEGDAILVLAGKGNNGGDALIASKYLEDSRRRIILLQSPYENFQSVLQSHFHQVTAIVDGLLGIGITGTLRPPLSEMIQILNHLRNQTSKPPTIVAIDIPSGLNSDTGEVAGAALEADVTLTMGLPKCGLLRSHGPDYVGQLEVVDIGLEKTLLDQTGFEAEWLVDYSWKFNIPKRKISAYKGSFGHVLILGGSRGMHGAPILACNAALRSGAGLVTIAVPESIYVPVASQTAEAMVIPLPSTLEGTFAENSLFRLESLLPKVTAIILGPGMGQNDAVRKVVNEMLNIATVPLLIDADALNGISGKPELLSGRKFPIIITPHPGEMARLVGGSSKEVARESWQIARDFASHQGITVVLKGARTVVAASSGPLWVNATGNPGMARGGSGDTLSGIIGSLLAQGVAPVEAAKTGVYWHGRAADLAARDGSMVTLSQMDIVTGLTKAIKS